MPIFNGTERSTRRRANPRRSLLTSAIVAACSALISPLAIVSTANAGGTIVVENCDNGGQGSLRQAIADSPDGGTVDLSQLQCSTITLASALRIEQNALYMIGPGQDALAIDAGGGDRVVQHTGTGPLTVQYLTLLNGAYRGGPYGDPGGGCVLSHGSLHLSDATISGCTLTSEYSTTSGDVHLGGCVFTNGDISLLRSHVRDCTASLADDEELDGGGITSSGGHIGLIESSVTGVRTSSGYTFGVSVTGFHGLTMKYSTIDDNADVGDEALGYASQAGGIQINGSIVINRSTISNNHARSCGAGISSGGPVDVRNSTLANNTGTLRTGGLCIINASEAIVANTTIAFNHANPGFASGVYLYGSALELQSTIIANNLAGTAERDIGGDDASSISGSHNLIPAFNIDVPADTLTADPELRALHYNGGPTRTLALNDTSAAIDEGDNPLGLDSDQRGPDFMREFGSFTDIGAFEHQPNTDAIFWDGFEP